MSRFDIIVPCYKYAHFLENCVVSALSQSISDVRVLIIDDASPDEAAAVAGRLVALDDRVHFRKHDVNRGHIATYNEGIEWVEGEYTILLSADDLLTPGSLSRAAGLMDSHPEVGLAYGRGIIFSSDPPPWDRPIPQSCGWTILEGAEFLDSCCEDGLNPICTPSAVTRTKLQKQLGGYRAELPHAGDMEMWMRFAAYSHVGILDEEQAYYRQHESNMSRRWYDATLADLGQRKAAFEAIFRDHGTSIPDSARLRSKADRSLAWSAFWAASKAFEDGDSSRCLEMLDFALVHDPGLRDRREYARYLWKRRVGRRLWSTIRPAVDLVRGRPHGLS